VLTLFAGPYAHRHYGARSRWRTRSQTGFRSGCDFDEVTDLILRVHGMGKVAGRYIEVHAEQLVEQDCIEAHGAGAVAAGHADRRANGARSRQGEGTKSGIVALGKSEYTTSVAATLVRDQLPHAPQE
jgi:hypothetical protein